MLKHRGDRAAAKGGDRGAACHRLDHYQPEGLGPLDREQQGCGIAKKLLFLNIIYRMNSTDSWHHAELRIKLKISANSEDKALADITSFTLC